MTQFVDHPESTCQFGMARQEITPPVGIYHRMWGAATHQQAAGVHRPLIAAVMVFRRAGADQPSDNDQIVVTLDHCILGPSELESLRKEVAQATAYDPSSLLFLYSHTHAAGLMALDRQELPGGEHIPPYLASINQTVAELARQALADLRPSLFTYATGRCNLAAHRDFRDEERDLWVCGYNPDGPADDTVMVVRVCETDGGLRAVLTNYACHPTTLAWENDQISPDFPGAMREVVETATGVPCLFLQGASGDLGPVDGYVGDLEVADRNGRQLGHATLAALYGLPAAGTRHQYQGPVVSGATLGAWTHQPLPEQRQQAIAAWQLTRLQVELPYRSGLPALADVQAEKTLWQQKKEAASASGDAQAMRDCHAMVERQTRLLWRLGGLVPGNHYPLAVYMWRIGDALWIALQGEPYQQLQIALRERFNSLPLVISTIANEASPAYLPPAELYDTGIYQETIAVLAPGCLEPLIEAISDKIAEIFELH